MKKQDREYHNIHYAVRTAYGRPDSCEFCFSTDSFMRFEWAHVHDAPMTIDRDNWLRLCKPCHNEYDDVYARASITLTGSTLSDEAKEKVSKAVRNRMSIPENREQVRQNQIQRIQNDPTLISKMRSGSQISCNCETCGRAFKNLGALATHRKIHKEES